MSSTTERAAAQRRSSRVKSGLDYIDDRFGSSPFMRSAMDKIFPDHWSFMVGEIAMYCFVVLIITGIYLALFYVPSSATIIYHGSYKPLDGQSMSAAYASVLNISFHVRAGLVMRQVHHWAAVVFVAALCFHMCRVFFTGAFRKPREVNWTIGLTLLMTVLLEGFSGYSLPDDLLSGTGLRVVYSIIESIPLIGTKLVFLLWGGPFPGTSLIPRLFVLHEFLFPALLVGLLSAHLAILWRQKHTDFPGPGKTETNIRGSRFFPQYMLKGGALMFLTTAVLCALGGFVQINPIWLYGPYQPYAVSAGSQPDWYVGWLDGSLRLWPHWEFRSFGYEIANPFFPGILFPGILFGVMYAWPLIDAWIYKDHVAHNLLDRPRDKPFRTAVGVAALAFFSVCTMASASDLLANDWHISYERIIEILQIGVFVAPIGFGLIAYRVCIQLQRTGNMIIKKPIGGIIVRGGDGAYHTLGDHHGDHGANGDRLGGDLTGGGHLVRTGGGRGGAGEGAPGGAGEAASGGAAGDEVQSQRGSGAPKEAPPGVAGGETEA
ncbi:MAG: cytochrome bc complex cytochrome b subunit [Actinomycetota bacterium]|nr:cytochrome bc complex cytochrome b subunit [Actinomycetota bacterium]